MVRLSLATRQREELVDVTAEVQQAVREAGLADGVVTVFVPHTTAGLTINENADPSVVADLLEGLRRIAPRAGSYRHAEGNSDAHLKASLVGSSLRVLVEGGKLALGTWQGIYFCEFDGPRRRQLWVQVG
jgi:secondary thiamine-phosphate synthase enzyme